MTRDPVTPDSVNHWLDRGALDPIFFCRRDPEFCSKCGQQLVEHVELLSRRDTRTGLPTHERLHSCPTWVTGWRTSRWARGWACPGMGHDSHDADNPMAARGYR